MKLHKIKFIVAATIISLGLFFSIAYSKDINNILKPDLKFNTDGKFKIVQFADIQDGPMTDPRTISLMNKILDYEKPDLVVLTGDNIDGKCRSASDVKTAIANIAAPMEKRKIPWAVAFGNHDDEHKIMTKEEMLKIYMSFPYNISQMGIIDNDRVGNYNLLVKSSRGDTPGFNVYMIDSGKYSPDQNDFEYIKESQIAWYKNTSAQLKEKYKKQIPSLMFFHIPIPEFKVMWDSGAALGARNEEECSPKFNSGLFDELVKAGDVKGVFVGHDHINDYAGKFQNIMLGYGRSTGYASYGKEGYSHGARVFLIHEKKPSDFETWVRLEQDF
ncbi:metallophosphoesterase family protein [Clostridium swellfunianum]|uniref:metallophosphoesterase family protein n=1 Tax=Clostridium swellfunianum TaxID=1367462 RepID=UPI002030ECF1|nr:metallophosphoesterase family protein [Clostridium swellfunianum]MCM0647922.1 metallophosphoesterase family protein [Clostridium swellfunianum]